MTSLRELLARALNRAFADGYLTNATSLTDDADVVLAEPAGSLPHIAPDADWERPQRIARGDDDGGQQP